MARVLIVDDDEQTRELRDPEGRLGLLFEKAPDAYYLNDLKGTFIDGNEAAEELTGYSREELIGKSFLKVKLLSPKQIPKASTLLARNALGKDTGPDEFILTRKDGKQVPVEICTRPVKIHGKRMVLGLARDITARKQAEETLDKERKRAQTYLNIAAVAMIALDEEGRITLVNRQGATILGYSEKELLGKDWFDTCIPDRLQSNVRGVFGQLMAGNIDLVEYYENPILTKDGEERIIAWHNVLLHDGEGMIIGTLSSGEDITERKQAEERIIHLNAVLRAIRKVNQLIVQEKDRDRLLKVACKDLVETRGYYNAWIALLDKSGKLVTAAEAGLGKKFLPLQERWKAGELPHCARVALAKPGISVIEDPPTTCGDCPLAGAYAGRWGLTCRLESEDNIYGLLAVSVTPDYAADEEEQSLFGEVAGDIGFALHGMELERERKKAEERWEQGLVGIIGAMASALEARDPYTAGHQRRVGALACAIAQEMGLSKEEINGLRMTATIHDLGKIQVPAEILSKPGKLTDTEFDLIKTHPRVGYDILKGIDFPWPVADIVLQHHEHLDGSGYPQGLKGEEILLEARILAVADVVEAMSSHRPYRPALGIDNALEEIEKNKGKLYDSEVADACIRLFTEGRFKFES